MISDKNTITLSLPKLGYTLETRKIIIPRENASKIISPRLQKKITKAIRNDDTITLTKDVLICPYCGSEIPAYLGFIFGESNYQSKHYSEIEKWSTYQMSFFGEEPVDLIFRTPVNISHPISCPKCHHFSNRSIDEYKKVSITKRRKKLTINLKIEIKEISKLAWIKQLSLTEFNLYEAITFNLNKGKTYLTLSNGKEKRYDTIDITGINVSKFKHDPIVQLIENYKTVYRIIKNFLLPYWYGTLPFSEKELCLERYILLTKFIGYDQSFYKAIPFKSTENEIEKSFVSTAEKLHLAKRVPKIYKESNLPNVKSIRRIIYAKPYFLFYKKELEVLWLSFNDVNYFKRLLDSASANIFSILAYLHDHPVVTTFLLDYAKYAGKPKLFSYLNENKDDFLYEASEYSTMSERAKEARRITWRNKRHINSLYSIPTLNNNEGKTTIPPDCMINYYRFIRLRNSYEFIKASKELHNCLGNWEYFERNTVYVIMDNNNYVAAVEVDNNKIVQARTWGNGNIDSDKRIYSAFKLWMKNNNLSYR